MASARPSAFKKAGGFLNGVDGVLKDYEFTDEFPGGGQSKSDFRSLYCVLTIQPDGAEDDLTTTLWAGGADDFEIEDNGHTLVPHDEDGGLRQGSEFDLFVNSAIKQGFDENLLPEDAINYESMLGRRYRFGQAQKLDKQGNVMKRLVKKGKFKGKEFDQTVTVIERVYDEAPTGKGKASSTGGRGRPAPEQDDDSNVVAEVAADVLKDILAKQKDNRIAKSKLSAKVIEVMLKHKRKDLREDVRKFLYDDRNLGSIDGVSYDKSDKNQIIALDE